MLPELSLFETFRNGFPEIQVSVSSVLTAPVGETLAQSPPREHGALDPLRKSPHGTKDEKVAELDGGSPGSSAVSM
jgi:hypothetical protein